MYICQSDFVGRLGKRSGIGFLQHGNSSFSQFIVAWQFSWEYLALKLTVEVELKRGLVF